MEYPPLKRHHSLQPLSREHFNGLRHARQLIRAAKLGFEERTQAAEEFGHAWRDEIAAHFDDEERLLGPLASEEDRERLMREHRSIRGLAERIMMAVERQEQIPAELARSLGEQLHDHIRWEERDLFEAVQRLASEEQLQSIAEQTAHVEVLRPGSRRRTSL